MASMALQLHGVSKSYGAVAALSDVTLKVVAGEVHALVGENGAGKSTLMGIAAGTTEPDAGTVRIAGTPLESASPAAAQALGIAVVYQNPAVIDDLTVLENLLLAMPAGRRPASARRVEWANERLAEVGLPLDLRARASELQPAQRQLLEIAKALALDPAVLVLDEPTESLVAEEVDRLFELVRARAARGTAVVYISHRISEVRRIADRITTLRDGRIRGTVDVGSVTDDDVVEMIVGRALSAVFPSKHTVVSGAPNLSTNSLSGVGFQSVDLSVYSGQIVGLAGVEGNGQREFLRSLAGLVRGTEGTVQIAGSPVSISTPSQASAAGIRFIPADRAREGLLATLSVAENITADALSGVSRSGFVSPGLERAAVRREVTATAIRTGSTATAVSKLSGGNQQKVVFARAMLSEPKVLLCDEPTRGVDVGARREIYTLLRRLSEGGRPVVVLSADAAELAGLCDTVLIFSRGRVVRTLTGDEVTENNITGAALRATREPVAAAAAETASRTATATSTATAQTAKPRRAAGLRARLSRSDLAPGGVVLAAVIVLALITGANQPTYLQSLNLSLLLYAGTALILIALGQLLVVLTAGIDLSVGPLAGMLVVVMSYVADSSTSAVGLALGLLITFAVAAAVGLVNGLLIAVVKMPPIVATLSTYIALQGASLLLRSTPGGSVNTGMTTSLLKSFGPIPLVFLLVLVIAGAAEFWLRRTRSGFALRSVGSSPVAATRLGVRARGVVVAAYVGCSLFTCLGAVLLAAQIGVGDPTQGTSYTLASVSAVVLGGASIYGGRGSFLAAVCGGLLLAVIANASTFLGLDQAWQYWLPGGLMLLATAAAARARGITLSALAT